MSARQRQLSRLRNFNTWIRQGDPKLGEEDADKRGLEGFEIAPTPGEIEQNIGLESIALRRTRPVLAIKENVTQLVFVDAADSEIWKQRLAASAQALDRPIRAVGRINLFGGGLEWVGTGWLVAENVLLTNRHVALAFARRDGDGFSFLMGDAGAISAAVDFLEEIDNPATLIFKLKRPLHIEEAPGPDISLFEVELTGGDPKLAQPLPLATKPMTTNTAAVIGYPAYDSRIPEPDLMEHIFGKIYNKKRLAPGAVTGLDATRIMHNCSTLGGNSGSALVDLDSGEALGLHFSGTFLSTNYAVRSDVVHELVDRARGGRVSRSEGRPQVADVQAAAFPTSTPSSMSYGAPPRHATPAGTNSASFTVPLTITISLGGLTSPAQHARLTSVAAADGGAVEGEEAIAEDYRDRAGYVSTFLGDGAEVVLPTLTRGADDVLSFEVHGKTETELKYVHYSVVMSRSRRMCLFSAVNIDGNLSKKSARVGWKWDPRIPKAQQIMNECYGNPPKFSRGHMTRREDPGWGDKATAKRGNEDSMHVTNTTPQMQAFNAPIWLALEDYALQHAREDAMKISVFTGPYFSPHDPEKYGVRIPRAFWKVITFIHDKTGKLCATGYEMSQETTLQQEEFVFGPFRSPQLQVATQVPIRSVEARSGLSFGRLPSLDPLAGTDEGLEAGLRMPVQELEQIRFV